MLESPIEGLDAEEAGRVAEYWRTNGDREIDRIDRELRGSAALRKIEGPARTTLRGKINQALSFVDRWFSLIRERPAERPKFHTQQAKKLREAVGEHLESAIREVVETPVAEGAVTLLARYRSLFETEVAETPNDSVGLAELLHGDLLAEPDIAFDSDGKPVGFPLPLDALDKLLRNPLDFSTSALERARRGDFANAVAAISFAERTGRIDDVDADRHRVVIEEHRAQFQRRLGNQLNDCNARLDAAYADGTLTLEAYEHEHARIAGIDPTGDSYRQQLEVLDDINRTISEAAASRLDALRQTLAGLDLPRDAKQRIDAVVSEGRLQIAEDFVERLEREEPLPPIETPRSQPLDRFFPHFVDALSDIGEQHEDGVAWVRQAIDERRSEGLVDASEMPQEAALEGVELLDAWVALRESPTSGRLLVALMEAVGFRSVSVKGSTTRTSGGETVFTLSSEPIADRKIVRIPDFGSRAGGSYRLFTVRGRATGEAILRDVRERHATGSSPSIVVFIGVLDLDARRMLARDFGTGECQPTLVLDEALVTFLAAWQGNRLAAFFDCAAAFAFSQPYDPDAPELPPEMFYGRSAARQAVVAMAGDLAHFVYGGRRLGKTALLADIAREYRARLQSEPKQLVLLVNLKGSGIGENRPTDDLWPYFGQRLVEHQVLQPNTVRPDTIANGVKGWLEEVPGRRILLLIDESDPFFEAERRPERAYRVLERIKVLMEETDRRFKVVFAGLHDVQRASNDPNTPFAHLGEAVRIGPMLPEIDGDEIHKLIRGPLEALGYRFTSSDSVVRIAAETNYYPALAQQFCKELLRTMRETAHTSAEQGPPFSIHPEMVDRVFNARETRNRVRNLFRWTIPARSAIRTVDVPHRTAQLRQQGREAASDADSGDSGGRTTGVARGFRARSQLLDVRGIA